MNCAQARAHLGDHLEGDLALRDRAEVDLHLEQCPDCSREIAEFRSTVALLRSLPDPKVPAGLVDSVMQRIDAGETRVTRLPLAVRRLFDPRVAAPLAAGIVALVLFATLKNENPTSTTTVANLPIEAPRAASPATSALDAEMWNGNRPTIGDRIGVVQRARFQVPPRLAAIQRNQAIRFFRPQTQIPSVGFYGRTDPDSQHLDLDAHLDRALNRPEAFLRFVSQIDKSDRSALITALAVRAARRGDAQNVAGQLRHATHPLAPKAAASFERFGTKSRAIQVIPASHQR